MPVPPVVLLLARSPQDRAFFVQGDPATTVPKLRPQEDMAILWSASHIALRCPILIQIFESFNMLK